MAAKDEELLELNRVVVDLQNRLQAARMDTDKNAVAELIAVRLLQYHSSLRLEWSNIIGIILALNLLLSLEKYSLLLRISTTNLWEI